MFAYIWVVSRVMWAFFQPHGVSHEKKTRGRRRMPPSLVHHGTVPNDDNWQKSLLPGSVFNTIYKHLPFLLHSDSNLIKHVWLQFTMKP